jgi:hypothetical protein
MKNLNPGWYKAILRSCVEQEQIPNMRDVVYHIDAELYDEERSIGVKRLFIMGRSKLVFDQRMQPNVPCKVDISKELILENISL